MSNLILLADAIARFEGFYMPNSVARRCNNPGNLVYAGQAGAVPHCVTGTDGKVRKYAQFPKIEDGWNALYAQIRRDAGRGLTLGAFVAKYAPPTDNNPTSEYQRFIGKRLNLPLETALSSAIGG